jgi:GH15 family glucan-1,4-alpha-glucosidase
VADEGWTVCRPDAVGDLLAAVREVKANVSPVSPERRDRLRAALWAGVAAAADPAERGGAAGSAVLSWLALDAAAGLPHWFGVADADAATAAATVAALQVRDRGWDASTQTFTAFDPAAGVEAASLLLCLSGLVPADDPAMIRTVERVAETLSAPCGLIYRYEAARGLEGPSLVCTYWLVRCLVAQGLLDRAEAIFEQATAYANDVGLLSEQSDPDTGRLLGNFPYGPSHAGLVLAARDLEQGRERSVTAARTSPPR